MDRSLKRIVIGRLLVRQFLGIYYFIMGHES